ncbi:MAG TPA: methylated-DNA--[protein]-cysteine S-methyltransferase, partial [Leptolinea sp.]
MSDIREEEISQYWDAIQNRRKSFDGKIYYGVKTTGIYCRPSCPSRKPALESVVFFFTTKDAHNSGYRACRRCHPDDGNIEDANISFMRISTLIEDQMEEINTVQTWAERANISIMKLRQIVKEAVGISPREYLIRRKMEMFKENIQTGENVTSSLYGAGFGSSSRLYEKATHHLGMTPAKYKNGGIGEKIIFAILDTPLGKLLVAGTTKGVCTVRFGESVDELKVSLQKEYSKAELITHSGELSNWISRINQYFAGKLKKFDIPLDIQASVFQMRVWEELRHIPFGETRSYSQIASALGQPSAARAVAKACAANP